MDVQWLTMLDRLFDRVILYSFSFVFNGAITVLRWRRQTA
jgi:hypothetical protein